MIPSFVDNVDAVVARIGTSNVGLVWGLANINWNNVDDRDNFLTAITNVQGG